MKQVSDLYGYKVIELGGGLGKTAFYALKFGIPSYTLVDIPMTLVAQANFLGRQFDPNTISLANEPEIRQDQDPTALNRLVQYDR